MRVRIAAFFEVLLLSGLLMVLLVSGVVWLGGPIDRTAEIFGALGLGGIVGALLTYLWNRVPQDMSPKSAWRATWLIVGTTILIGLFVIFNP